MTRGGAIEVIRHSSKEVWKAEHQTSCLLERVHLVLVQFGAFGCI